MVALIDARLKNTRVLLRLNLNSRVQMQFSISSQLGYIS